MSAYRRAVEDPGGREIPMLVGRADPGEREALLALGPPFSAPRRGRDRVRTVLDDATDSDEIGELVTESDRILAPRKLVSDEFPGWASS